MAWTTLFWVHAAFGGTPVVFDEGSGDEALAYVAERTGLPVTQLTAWPLGEVLEASPEALGDAVLRRCSREVTDPEAVRTDVARAEAAWLARDIITTMDHLDLAVSRLGCLGGVVDSKVAGRAFQLRGAQMAAQGDIEGGAGEFATALALDPELTWEEELPDAGRVMFAEALLKDAAATLRALPVGLPSGPWLNGRALSQPTAVAPGLHLFQYATPRGVRSAWVSVGGDATLVIPHSHRRPVLERLAEGPASASEVGALLQAAIPDLTGAYVTHREGLWLLTVEDGLVSTTELQPMKPDEPEVPETPKERKKRLREEKKAARERG